MDLDDLDEPTKASAKASRFAPKPKFQPKSKQSRPQPPKQEPPPPAQVAAPSVPLVVKREEESQSVAASSSTVYIDVDGVGGGEPSAVNGAVQPKQEAEEREIVQADGDAVEVHKINEEEDSVVAEYDVYFNPSGNDTQLFAFQYPLRPKWRPYELDQRCKEIRVKPNSRDVEVDLVVDTDSDNYNPDASSATAMPKQTLSAQWGSSQATGYAVAVLMGKKLYVNPIQAVVQLRPSMEYLDSGSKKRNIPDTAVKVEGSTSLSRKQSKQMDSEVAESWIPLKYYSSTSELSDRFLGKMVTEEHNPLQFPLNPYDYMNSLCPAAAISKMKPKGPSMRSLLHLPLEERLKKWLAEGPPIQRFRAILHLTPNEPKEVVLQVLQKYATLIQGCWVAKPAIRHPNAPGSELGPRDYVLNLFSQRPVIKDSELDVLGSRKSFAKTVLREIAVERTNCKDWKFKEDTDVLFIKEHLAVVEQQEKQWHDRWNRLRAQLPQLRAAKGSARPEKIVKPGSSVISGKDPPKAANGERSSRMSMSKETREALPKVLRLLFQDHKVCSFQTICQGLRGMALAKSNHPKADPRAADARAAALGLDAPQEELQAAISDVAECVNGVYVLKSLSDHPELNPLRSVVIELYRGTPNAKLKKSEIIEAAKIKLQREPTNNEFQKVMTELCVSRGGAWYLKSGDGAPK